MDIPPSPSYPTIHYTLTFLGWGVGDNLTLSQTTIFGLFQTESICKTTISNFMKNVKMYSKQVENTVGKGEIAHYEQFLLFQQCFQKTCTAKT